MQDWCFPQQCVAPVLFVHIRLVFYPQMLFCPHAAAAYPRLVAASLLLPSPKLFLHSRHLLHNRRLLGGTPHVPKMLFSSSSCPLAPVRGLAGASISCGWRSGCPCSARLWPVGWEGMAMGCPALSTQEVLWVWKASSLFTYLIPLGLYRKQSFCLFRTSLMHSFCPCTVFSYSDASIGDNQRCRNLLISLLKPSTLSSRQGPGAAELSLAELSWADPGQPSSWLQLDPHCAAPMAELGMCMFSSLSLLIFPEKSTLSSPPSLPLIVHSYFATGSSLLLFPETFSPLLAAPSSRV